MEEEMAVEPAAVDAMCLARFPSHSDDCVDAMARIEYDTYLQERITLESETEYHQALMPLLQQHERMPFGGYGLAASSQPPPSSAIAFGGLAHSPFQPSHVNNMFALPRPTVSKRTAVPDHANANAKRQCGAVLHSHGFMDE